jgi:formylglycine-generating enzyme required for sulfatase activity
LNITIDDFEISKFEITNSQYSTFLISYGDDEVNSGEFKGEKMIYENDKGLKYLQGSWKPVIGYDNFPIVGVTWYGAIEFCKYYNYRLPTEVEWEYAAKELGKKIRFGNGKDTINLKEINYNPKETKDSAENSNQNNLSQSPQSVGAYPPNILGIFQMSGNVWEWCLDWYEFNYDSTRTINPTGPWLGKYKVIRGGSFNSISSAVRTTERSFIAPHRYNSDIGFRVAKSIQLQESIQEEKSND